MGVSHLLLYYYTSLYQFGFIYILPTENTKKYGQEELIDLSEIMRWRNVFSF